MTEITVTEDQKLTAWGLTPHLRIMREDGGTLSWDELQLIKNEYWGADAVAVEVYPPVSDLVDEIPARHLWLVPPEVTWPNLRRR